VCEFLCHEPENDIREGCSEEISEGGEGGREGHTEGRSEAGFSDGIIHSFHSEGSMSDDSDGIADAVGQDVVVRDYVTSVLKFSKMDERCSAETKKSGGEPCLEQQERAEPHWSPSNECVSIYGEKFKQLLEWAERKARERAERDQNEQKTDALHNAFSFGNPSS